MIGIRDPGGVEPLALCNPEEGCYLSLKAESELRLLGQYQVCLQAAKPHKQELRWGEGKKKHLINAKPAVLKSNSQDSSGSRIGQVRGQSPTLYTRGWWTSFHPPATLPHC